MRGRVEICGINTAKLPVLKHEENMALLRRVKQGDEQARQELICGNLRGAGGGEALCGPQRERG